MNINSTDLELVNDGALGNQTVGLRFEDFLLPLGAILTSADIQFTADEVQSETTSLTIRAQAADNAPIFTTDANNLASRPLTTASVAWNPEPWNTIGERGPLQCTPDLSALVHEVMKRPGWASGNALAFLITGTGHRTAEAIEKSGGTPATLNVTYQTELPLGTFMRWSASQTNAGMPAADPDDDGLNNLMEYALGLDPAVPNHGAILLTFESDNLALTYTRPSAVIDLTYSVQWADTLGSTWSSIGVTQQIINDDGARRTIRAVLPKGTLRQRFVRLKVTQ